MSLSVKSRNLGFGIILSAGVALSLSPIGGANAAPVYSVDTGVYAGNWVDASSAVVADYVPSVVEQNGSVASASMQGSSLGSAGNVVTYSASAQSSLAGGLKVTSSISGDRLRWDAGDAPYVLADGSVDESGVPHFYGTRAGASIFDTLTVSGAADLTGIAFLLHVDGTLYNDVWDGNNRAMSRISLNGGGQHIFSANPPGYAEYGYQEFAETVTSGLFNVVNGQVAFDLSLAVWSEYGDIFGYSQTQGSGELPSGEAYADFFNTVTIADIFGFNAAGQRVSLFSVTGSDGTVLPAALAPPVSAVPEPATWAMMITGFGIVGGALRRRNHALAFA